MLVRRLRDVSTFPDKMAAACCTSPPSAVVGSGSGCRRVCRDVRTGFCVWCVCVCVRVCVWCVCVCVWCVCVCGVCGVCVCVWGGYLICV